VAKEVVTSYTRLTPLKWPCLKLLRAEQDTHGGIGELGVVAADAVLAGRELVQAHGRDGIEGLDCEPLALVAARRGGGRRRSLGRLAVPTAGSTPQRSRHISYVMRVPSI